MTITGKGIDIGQGWPLAEDIDAALKVGNSLVSIYPVPGAGGRPPQIFDFDPGTVQPAAHGLTASVSGTTVSLSGTSLIGEVVGLTIDYTKFYSHASPSPETSASVINALLALVQADYPGATTSGTSLTIAGAHALEADVGGVATIGQKVHRQSTQFRIVVWSPNPSDRTTIARAIDVAVKRDPIFPMPDTSVAIITYEGTNLSDKEENAGVYRRDIMMTALYDTIDEYQAVEVIGVRPSLQTSLP